MYLLWDVEKAKTMTDTEINEAVARKLRWERSPEHDDCWARGYLADLLVRVDLPDYCRSIAAAWEICEFQSGCMTLTDVGLSWKCEFHLTPLTVEARSDTAPMAICLAFLKLP